MDTDRRSWLARMVAGVTLLFTRCSPAPARESQLNTPPEYFPPSKVAHYEAMRAKEAADPRSEWARLADHVRDYATQKNGLSKYEADYLRDLVWVYTPVVQRREDRVREFVDNFRGLTMTVVEVDHAHAIIQECAAGQPGETKAAANHRRWHGLRARLEGRAFEIHDARGMIICHDCLEPFVFELDEPFAHCRCGTCEWGNEGDKYRQIQQIEALRARLREKSPLFSPDRMPDSALQETIDYVEQTCPPDALPDWYDKLVEERNRRDALRTSASDPA